MKAMDASFAVPTGMDMWRIFQKKGKAMLMYGRTVHRLVGGTFMCHSLTRYKRTLESTSAQCAEGN